MEISFWKYDLILKHKFSISYHSRKKTPTILVRIRQGKFEGFGEASLPPYLKETQESVIDFFKKVKLNEITSFEDLILLEKEINRVSQNNNAAKAAISIALHDLLGKINEKPCYSFYNIHPHKLPDTSFTIGIDTPQKIVEKISEADSYKILKIKLGTKNDKQVIDIIRKHTDKPLYVDVNQGWDDKYYALDFVHYLANENVLLVEQPFHVSKNDDSLWLSERSPIPIIADESIRSIEDVDKVKNCFTGINIKLMKCGGVLNAYRMIMRGRENNLKIMLGCMTESSCAVSAAIHLVALADYADLDGNLLIENDPFVCNTVLDGKLIIPDGFGLGIKPGEYFLDK